MKNLILIILTMLLFNTLGLAQTFQLREGVVTHNGELRPSVKVMLSPAPKDIKKAWKKFMEKAYDVKVDGIGLFSNKDVLTAEKVTIPKISNKEIDLFNKVIESPQGAEMNVFAAMGYDIYVDKEKDLGSFEAMRELTLSFINKFLPGYIEDRIDDIEGEVDDLRDDIADMKKTIKDNREKIVDLERENVDLEKKINEKSQMLENSISELASEKEKLKNTKKKIDRISNQ